MTDRILIAVNANETSAFFMLIWHPVLSPAVVELPSTMTIVVCEVMLHDVAEVPDDGLLPKTAIQLKLVVNPDPVSVTVLPE